MVQTRSRNIHNKFGVKIVKIFIQIYAKSIQLHVLLQNLYQICALLVKSNFNVNHLNFFLRFLNKQINKIDKIRYKIFYFSYIPCLWPYMYNHVTLIWHSSAINDVHWISIKYFFERKHKDGLLFK